MPELPFSNIWIAQLTADKLPPNSTIHFGILSSLRAWNFFELPETVSAYCNTGGFGIDGCLSSLLGASLASPERLFFGVIGDLAFYYDINALGNRHIASNLRLMLINNGLGQEFLYSQGLSGSSLGRKSEPFIAAKGHFAGQSGEFLRHYAEDLGFEYLSASNKEEYLANLERFTSPKMRDKPVFFEIFTKSEDETESFDLVSNINAAKISPVSLRLKKAVKKTAKKVLGARGIRIAKQILGK